LSLYKTVPFYDNWLDVSGLKEGSGVDHTCRLDPSFFDIFEHMTVTKKKQWRIEAAQRCHETLGPYPALCFSGGIDSQAMLHCFSEADLEAHVIIFTFKDSLNKQDSDHAKMYCLEHDIPYREIEFDIVSFLTRDNTDITRKYGSTSPHFNTHYRFVEVLTHLGYTGVCFGGQAPDRLNGIYGSNLDKVPMRWSVISDKFQIANQGSFLSFSPELAWATTLSTPPFDSSVNIDQLNNLAQSDKNRTYKEYRELVHERYKLKIQGYTNMGFSIIPQETKYTGFELVNTHFEKLHNDGWFFEKQFRQPLSRLDGGKYNKDTHQYKIGLNPDQTEKLENIYLKKFASRP